MSCGCTQTAMDQLHMHFTTAIHTKAFHIVLGYVQLVRGDGGTSFQKRSYADLCKVTNPTLNIILSPVVLLGLVVLLFPVTMGVIDLSVRPFVRVILLGA